MLMQTETLYKTKLVINILMASMTLLLLAIFVFNLDIPCLFKSVFHFNCPACGLTRSFKAIMHFNFKKSLEYNILGLPLFLSIIISYFLYFKDLLFNTNTFIKLYFKISKYYWYIILILIIAFILNNW